MTSGSGSISREVAPRAPARGTRSRRPSSSARTPGTRAAARRTARPARPERLQRFAHPPLVLRVKEREEQADRDRLDLGRAHGLDRLPERALVERPHDALRAHPLPHGEPQLARDERRGPVRRQVVERRAVLPPDLDHVAEPLGGDERGSRAAPLEQRVRRDRRPVREHADRPRSRPRAAPPPPTPRPDGTFAVTSSPSTTATRSVNVPPTSTPTATLLILGNPPPDKVSRRMATTKMPSSLEIAQSATLRPITEIAEEIGPPRRRGRALRPLQGEGRPLRSRAPRRPAERQARRRHRDHADEGGRGQDDDRGRAHPGPRQDRQEPGALPARGVARAGVRDQGRRGRRRLLAGRADGGPEPPLHRRHPRDRRREQPALGDARGAHPARERARDRPADASAGGAAWT